MGFKLKLNKIIILGFIIFLFTFFFSCTDNGDPKIYTVVYDSSVGGSVVGELSQTVVAGANATEVTALAETGYIFSNWSDGIESEKREDLNITQNLSVTAIFMKLTYQVNYYAGLDGVIEGDQSQIIGYGENSFPVQAIPNEGYEFFRWSDGLDNPERSENNVVDNISVEASFIKLEKIYTYNYNNATDNIITTEVTISFESFEDVKLIVPIKENSIFGGWFLDKDISIQVSDESGDLIIGKEIFQHQSNQFYAKWTAKTQITYKILMVFVTEIHTIIDGFAIDYKMKNIDKQIFELMQRELSKYLNEWFYGLVNFEIDILYTTIPLNEKNFDSGNNSGKITYYIMADNIPEVEGIIRDYHSVITSFSMNDFDWILHSVSGMGSIKFACIHWEDFIGRDADNEAFSNSLLDITSFNWNTFKEAYLHEFTHTIEQSLDVYEFHSIFLNNSSFDHLTLIKLYLLNQLVIDGNKVGIPYSYWLDL
ncbi:hypothetical protein EZS27_017616 [termite gut metagenome]|uniref:Bacterial repeat domain-containing protein n=1 Tax=termite gut metagenome TaxID=433724 RepID=A0A5J4RKD2_9ZZZZ